MKNVVMIALMFVTSVAWSQDLKNFNLVNVLNGQQISPSSFPSCSGLVIIFTSNACPYDEYYRNRMAALAQSYSDKVPVLLVNAHPEDVENRDNMLKKAKQLNLSIPYLADKDQSLMTTLNAKKSPEAFLLKNNGGTFSVVYHGAIDDNAQVEADVRHPYLKDAIDILLSNQQIATAEVRPVGCNLKKK
jgi:hypothetical protein